MNAQRKWLMLFLDIMSWELAQEHNGELLSQGCDRLIEKRPIVGRSLIIAAGTVLTLHLSNSISDRYDLMSKRFWAWI